MTYTSDDFLSVRCPFCGAGPGESCVKRGGPDAGDSLPLDSDGDPRFHSKRVLLRKRGGAPAGVGAVRWVPMRDLFRSGLGVEEIMAAMRLALPDLGLAYAIRLVDGEQAAERYLAASGRVRIGPDGEPQVPVKGDIPS